VPAAKNRWERAVQVLRWLKEEFNLPADLQLRIESEIDCDEVMGQVEEIDGKLVIFLSAKMCRSVNETLDTTIHEAAHVKLWEKGLGHLHGPVFWKTFGRMMDAFDHHGHMDSRTYPLS
jgi:hypothetical protein